MARMQAFAVLMAGVSVVFLFSCQKKDEKKIFSEVKGVDSPVERNAISAPAAAAAAAETPVQAQPAADGGRLDWTLPRGWTAQVGSGMYYAIIKTSEKPDAGEIGILSLPGEAGGLQANVVRWLGQLGRQLPPDQLQAFLAKKQVLKSQGGLEVVFLDFNSVVHEPDAQSMLMGIAPVGGQSYFIKWMAPRSDLETGTKAFLEFCRSLGVPAG